MIVTAVGIAPERSFSARSSADLTSNRPEICPRSLMTSLMTGAEMTTLPLELPRTIAIFLRRFSRVAAWNRFPASGESTKSTTLRCIESAPRRAERQVVARRSPRSTGAATRTPVRVPLDSDVDLGGELDVRRAPCRRASGSSLPWSPAASSASKSVTPWRVGDRLPLEDRPDPAARPWRARGPRGREARRRCGRRSFPASG